MSELAGLVDDNLALGASSNPIQRSNMILNVCTAARKVGADLNKVHAGLIAAGDHVKRGRLKNMPRADGSIPKMVQVGQIASRNDPNTQLRCDSPLTPFPTSPQASSMPLTLALPKAALSTHL